MNNPIQKTVIACGFLILVGANYHVNTLIRNNDELTEIASAINEDIIREVLWNVDNPDQMRDEPKVVDENIISDNGGTVMFVPLSEKPSQPPMNPYLKK